VADSGRSREKGSDGIDEKEESGKYRKDGKRLQLVIQERPVSHVVKNHSK